MKVLLQRVSRASVTVEGQVVGSIGRGYLLFVGVLTGDTSDNAAFLAKKIAALRLFSGLDGKVNDRSLKDIEGEVLVVSQFTLVGQTEKGNRPDYTAAAERGIAERLYEEFADFLRSEGISTVEKGVFGAHMQVALENDGPVTLLLERSGHVPS